MELTEYEERRPRLAPLGSGSASASRAGLAGFLVIAIIRYANITRPAAAIGSAATGV